MIRMLLIGAVAVVAVLIPVAAHSQSSKTLSVVQTNAAASAQANAQLALFVPAKTYDDGRAGMVMSLLASAQPLLGLRYRYGGSSTTHGFDCSGFVRHVFAQIGVELPRTAHEMASFGEHVTLQPADTSAQLESSPRKHRTRSPLAPGALMPGDLLFFAAPGNSDRIDHVAIYAGDSTVLHSAKHGGIRYDRIYSARGRWLRSRFIGARRVLPAPVTAPVSPAVEDSSGIGP